MKDTIRLAVIDDSTSFRELLNLMLQGHAHLKVVGLAEDGEKGMKLVSDQRPDVILLDLEMPKMDGFTFLRWMMANIPTPTLVLSGRADANNVFKALEFGACDFLNKLHMHEAWFKRSREFIAKIEAVATIPREKLNRSVRATRKSDKIDHLPKKTPGLLAIGASTGGPRALYEVIGRLPQNFPVPIVISQHMPGEFTPAFSDTLNRKSLLPTSEAKAGEPLEKGHVYLAPGGSHLLFEKRDDTVYTVIQKATDADLYIPSIDRMMCSAADLFGPNILGVVLTGMGHDGRMGLQAIKAKGGVTFAESEETAVIYGMPKAAIEAKVVDQVFPLHKMVDAILDHYAAMQ
jgi:two-component system chemotaxis response regulator CheB